MQYKLLSSAPVRDVERKLLLIPMIFMLISAVCFMSDLYFFINYKKNLKNLQKNNSSIVFVHFLIVSICDSICVCMHMYTFMQANYISVCVYMCLCLSVCLSICLST